MATLVDLPDSLLERVLMEAGPCVASLSLVCRRLLRVLSAPTARALERVHALIDEVDVLLRKPGSVDLGGQAERRIGYLAETARLLRALNVRSHHSLHAKLLLVMLPSLQETVDVMQRVRGGLFEVGSNFDVFDLTLRRYYYQLQALYPLRPVSELIRDREAREAWMAGVGPTTYFTTWDAFSKHFLSAHSSTMVEALRFLVNFPKDDMITVYKFDLMCTQFGPFANLHGNAQCVLRPGFVGLVNRIEAEEMLREEARKYAARRASMQGVFLFRLSRTEPQYLAFSCLRRDGTVEHTLSRRGLSVEAKIAKDFPKSEFRRVDIRLDHSKLRTRKTLAQYSSHGSYVVFHSSSEDGESGDEADNAVSSSGEDGMDGHDDLSRSAYCAIDAD